MLLNLCIFRRSDIRERGEAQIPEDGCVEAMIHERAG